MRIGFGFDTHQLVENRPLMIGGISIEHTKGSLGHSDGDVLIHSICDALLGAMGLADIGTHFPDYDPKLAGIDSKILLRQVVEMMSEKGFSINNIDTTIVLQQPKLVPYIQQMKESLCPILAISINQMAIKAKTSEKLGFIGREEGVSAYAVVLIEARRTVKGAKHPFQKPRVKS
jgi:2-C-methyl-D-erythritol 2,4-cyclodiphosphate synthase